MPHENYTNAELFRIIRTQVRDQSILSALDVLRTRMIDAASIVDALPQREPDMMLADIDDIAALLDMSPRP